MIPIEKNVIVSDGNGRRIGATYPKRAKGLVKNGRAEYISDQEIRLLNTRLPAVSIDTEDISMSKVIQFNARAFELEETCNTNVGYRGFITTASGNEEIWEIGDWGWNWTSLCSTIKGLEQNTDYVFRFAMTLGHNDDNREESMVHIHYVGEDGKKAWNDRFTYCIGKSRFKPVISKRALDEDTMIRVFELPFHTGEHTDFRIVIIAQHAVARFYRAGDNEFYAGLEDLSYEQWRKNRTVYLEEQAAVQNQKRNFQASPVPEIPGFPEMESMVEDSVRETLESVMEDSRAEIADMLEERIEETISNSISELLGEGIENYLSANQLTLNDGTVIAARQKTKVLSPDKKKLLTCYGGLVVEDTSKWNGAVPKGWGLRVQTRLSAWELLYVYETEKEATDALVHINEAIKAGMSLIEL